MATVGSPTAAPAAARVGAARIPLVAAPGVSEKDVADVLAFGPFVEWAAAVPAGINVSGITVQSVDRFGARLGFVKIDVAATRVDDGSRVPGIVFLRGGGAWHEASVELAGVRGGGGEDLHAAICRPHPTPDPRRCRFIGSLAHSPVPLVPLVLLSILPVSSQPW
jgi:hypothetical protein